MERRGFISDFQHGEPKIMKYVDEAVELPVHRFIKFAAIVKRRPNSQTRAKYAAARAVSTAVESRGSAVGAGTAAGIAKQVGELFLPQRDVWPHSSAGLRRRVGQLFIVFIGQRTRHFGQTSMGTPEK
jgi:hypothetical protein